MLVVVGRVWRCVWVSSEHRNLSDYGVAKGMCGDQCREECREEDEFTSAWISRWVWMGAEHNFSGTGFFGQFKP